jgi:hypothetical protein
MDRNVANTDGNTHKKLAQHADRSGDADCYFGPIRPKVRIKATRHSLQCWSKPK